jgi:hypothetical protein
VPSTLSVAAGYLLVVGICGLLVQLLQLGPNHPEFQAQTSAFRIGAQTRELAFAAISVVAAIGLFGHHAWARTLALVLLVVEIMFTSNAFAWGFSKGRPTRRVLFISRIAMALWNGFWFYLIFRLAL